MKDFKHISSNVDDTKRIINNFLSMNKDLELFILIGPLGVGKTVVANSIGSYFGIKQPLTSPTFSLKKNYKNLIHYDLFFIRKLKTEEFYSNLKEDLLDNRVIIEWGKKVKIPHKTKAVTIDINYHSPESDERVIKIKLKK